MRRSSSGFSHTPLVLGATLSMFQSTSFSNSFLRSFKIIGPPVRASSDFLIKFSRLSITQPLITLDSNQARHRMHPLATKQQT